MRPGLEIGTENTEIGMDPRKMAPDQLKSLGHEMLPILSVIRARCVDCSGGSQTEVRYCTAIKCVLWPYRMGTNPFREKKVLSQERRNKLKDQLAKGREKKVNAS